MRNFLLSILLLSSIEAYSQSYDKWSMTIRLGREAWIHNVDGEELYRVKFTNQYRVGWQKKSIELGYWTEGHDHYFVWHDADGTGAAGLYFAHDIPIFGKFMRKKNMPEINIEHRFLGFGNELGSNGVWRRYTPTATLSVPFGRNLYMQWYTGMRYECVTVGFMTGVRF